MPLYRRNARFSRRYTRRPAFNRGRFPYRRRYVARRSFGGRSKMMVKPTVEIKSFDQTFAANTVIVAFPSIAHGTGPADLSNGMTHVNAVVQGADYYKRIGQKINMKSCQLDFTVGAPTSYTVPCVVRWCLIYDRQPNADYPSIGDIFYTSAGATTFNSGVNMQNRNRFSVIRDQRFTLDPAQDLLKPVHEFVKLSHETDFNQTNAGTIGDLTTGSLLFMIGYDGTIAEPAPTLISWQSRIRYFD